MRSNIYTPRTFWKDPLWPKTLYLQALIGKRKADGSADRIAEAYKDYRGIRNGIYYAIIKNAADNLVEKPESMQVLRDMVK